MITLEGPELLVGVQIEALGFSAGKDSSHVLGAGGDVRVELE